MKKAPLWISEIIVRFLAQETVTPLIVSVTGHIYSREGTLFVCVSLFIFT